MYEPTIILDGAPNARDLGGIETSDGRVLRKGKLIRSGSLSKITERDIEYLKSINLRAIVDLRSIEEQNKNPDRTIEGAEHIPCPILERKTDGITRTRPETPDEEAIRTVKMAERLMAHGTDGIAQMKSLYPMLVSLEHALLHYRRFFEILLGQEDGAVLFHCSMGKDRAGTAAALLLSALNVPRETIVCDYMITRERCAAGTQVLLENCRRYTDDDTMLEFIYHLDTVQEDFIAAAFDTIDELHGGMDCFLREKMGLYDTELNKLRQLYLE